jgi:hypothetical protein
MSDLDELSNALARADGLLDKLMVLLARDRHVPRRAAKWARMIAFVQDTRAMLQRRMLAHMPLDRAMPQSPQHRQELDR